MGKILIGFLGKARKDQEQGQYRLAQYRFSDDNIVSTRFFGSALAKRVQPDRLILLGTSSSMWDVLLEEFCINNELYNDRIRLMDDVQQGTVRQERLDVLAPLLSRALDMECCLRVIPHGRDEPEQVDILQIMADALNENDVLHLDLTHGFRHLPMLGLLSAMCLRTLKQVKIGGMYYGALDMTDNDTKETPVLCLDGLLHIADWVSAIERYDHSGDYGVFSRLLPDVSEVKALEQAAYYERITNSVQAKEKLTAFSGWFQNADRSLSPAMRLFRKSLEQRIAWYKKPNREEREQELAQNYLMRKDYLRSLIFGCEALITRAANLKHQNPADFQVREEVDKELRRNNGDYRFLKEMRNTIVHSAINVDLQLQKVFKNPNGAQKKIQDLFIKLF